MADLRIERVSNLDIRWHRVRSGPGIPIQSKQDACPHAGRQHLAGNQLDQAVSLSQSLK